MRAFVAGLILAALFWLTGCSSRTASPRLQPVTFAAPSYENLPDAARNDLRQAWQAAGQKSDDAATVARFGMMLLSYGQPQAAIAPLQRAQELEADNFAWLYYLGTAQAAAGHPAEALELFKKGLAKKPNFVPLQLKLAEAFLAAGRLAEAEHACLAILLAHPDAVAVHGTLAGVYERSGKSIEAQQEKTLAAGPAVKLPYLKDPWMDALHEWKPPEAKSSASAERQVHFEKGRELLAKKRYPQAIEELKLTLVPEDHETPGYLLTISIAYQQAGDSQNALDSAQKAQQMALDLGQKELIPAIDAQLASLADGSAVTGATGSTGKTTKATAASTPGRGSPRR
jgi:tetratricopeptide (TPR) repeat protein